MMVSSKYICQLLWTSRLLLLCNATAAFSRRTRVALGTGRRPNS